MLRRNLSLNARFYSPAQNGFKIFSVTGTNVATFGIEFSDAADTKNLIGWGVTRTAAGKSSAEVLPSRKWFYDDFANDTTGQRQQELVDSHTSGAVPMQTSFEVPLQTFTIDDAGVEPDTQYQYKFYPMTLAPGANPRADLKKGRNPISITVRTEPQFDSPAGKKRMHNIIFNRGGMAASQEFAEKYACGRAAGCEHAGLQSIDLKLPGLAADAVASWSFAALDEAEVADLLSWARHALSLPDNNKSLKTLKDLSGVGAAAKKTLVARAKLLAEAKEYLSGDLLQGFLAFIGQAGRGDELLCLFYEFNEPTILHAIHDAAERGATVRIVVDMNNSVDKNAAKSPGSATLKALRTHGFPVPVVAGLLEEGDPRGVKDGRKKLTGIADGIPAATAGPRRFPATGGSITVTARTLRPNGTSKSDPRYGDAAIRSKTKVRNQQDHLQHNKAMVLSRGGKPLELWTGSANVTTSALIGQLNVATWSRAPDLAATYHKYITNAAFDPSLQATRTFVDAQTDHAPTTVAEIPAGKGTTLAVFSPRSKPAGLDPVEKAGVKWWETSKPGCRDTILHTYFQLLAGDIDNKRKTSFAAMTLPFGVPQPLSALLVREADPATWAKAATSHALLNGRLRSADQTAALKKVKSLKLAIGSNLAGPVGDFVLETNSLELQLSTFVPYIHSKFAMSNPLSQDSIVVAGSANFSSASTYDNDENMLIFRGQSEIADIFFTSFSRVFYHYRLRNKVNSLFDTASAAAQHDAGVKVVLQEMTEAAFWKRENVSQLVAQGKLNPEKIDLSKSKAGDSDEEKTIKQMWANRAVQIDTRNQVLASTGFWTNPIVNKKLASTRDKIVKKLQSGTVGVGVFSDDSWVENKFGDEATGASKQRLSHILSMEGAKLAAK